MRHLKYMQTALEKLTDLAEREGEAVVKTKQGNLLLVARGEADKRTSLSNSVVSTLDVYHFNTLILSANFEEEDLKEALSADVYSQTDARIIQNALSFYLSHDDFCRVDVGYGPVSGARFNVE